MNDASRYSNLGHRDEAARKATADLATRMRQRRYAETAANGLPAHVPHGTEYARTAYGCKCADCRAAHAEYNNRRNRARRERTA